MLLTLERCDLKPICTIGSLSVDGEWECWVLEDPVREGPKIPGMTAIPYGRYAMDITFSNRFHQMLPIILNVPNFTGVRIHWGNYAKDTEGCPLVGQDRFRTSVGRSRAAFDRLFPKLKAAKSKGEQMWIEIVKAPQI